MNSASWNIKAKYFENGVWEKIGDNYWTKTRVISRLDDKAQKIKNDTVNDAVNDAVSTQ